MRYAEELLTRPIIIIGAPRSGTSMLGRILSHHRDLAYLGEPRLTWKYGNDGKSDMLRREDARPRVIAHIRARFAQAVHEAGASRLLEKTPSNSLRPAFVDAVFPDCQFVHILRDGVSSAVSIATFWGRHAHGVRNVAPGRSRQRLSELSPLRMPFYAMEFVRRAVPEFLRPIVGRNVWGPRLPGMRQMAREMTPLQIACLQWRTCVEVMCQFGRQLPAERYMECRLEEMGEGLIQRVMAFTGLPEDPAVFDYFREHFDPGQPGARKRERDPATLEAVRQTLAPTLQYLGFE